MHFRLPTIAAILLLGLLLSSGCQNALRKNCITPECIPVEDLHPPRNLNVPIDHRLLEGPKESEHLVDSMDVLGIYIADVLGSREQLPPVSYPGFRSSPAPIKPFVGHPITVESDGTIQLPYVDPVFVRGMNLVEVRSAIRKAYSKTKDNQGKDVIKPGREHIQVSLITPRIIRVHVFRQDTRYNTPGTSNREEFDTSKKWAGTTIYLETKDAHILSALMRTGGLPGIDAKNEIWIMKGLDKQRVDTLYRSTPIENKLEGIFPMMIGKDDSKLIKIPLSSQVDSGVPFSRDDAILGDGDVVYLPRRDGDTFLTGGLLPPGRFPLDRDRDLDIVEAIAKAAGSNMGIPGAWNSALRFTGGPGAIVPPTEVIIVRRTSQNGQYKIKLDLKKAMNDEIHRVRIIPGDLIILQHKPKELALNIAINIFNFNYTLSNVFNPAN